MSIHEFSTIRSRYQIGIAGEVPAHSLSDRLPGYELYQLTTESLSTPGLIETTAATLFIQSDKHPRRIAHYLSEFAPTLLQHGCLVFVQPLSAELGTGTHAANMRRFVVDAIDQNQLPASGLLHEERELIGSSPLTAGGQTLTPMVHLLTRPDDWQGLLKILQLHPPGEAHAGITIRFSDPDGGGHKLDPEHEILFRRAFHDCSEVHLEPLRNGLSNVDAYRVYAQQRADQAGGRWPYRYFVKVGSRRKISDEYQHYRDIALEHLPYHLGPRLRLDRCALGHRNGIIVSDYVAGAEPLRDCARNGRAVAAIANLFNVTFRGWHNGATPDLLALKEHLSRRLPSEVPAWRKPMIEELGAGTPLDWLNISLMSRAETSSPVMLGVIHGDLHATNVLVRDNDAILIDFERVEKRAPVLRDMACLEGGLFVDGFVGDKRSPADILASIRCLYGRDALIDGRLNACHPSDGSSWFFDCVMQVRLHARQFERAPGQYAIALASELLKKACNDHNFDEPYATGGGPISGATVTGPGDMRVRMEQTRAMAYILAEWILKDPM